MYSMHPIANRRIAVIGLGYVGLPVAVAFAKLGSVIGYDHNVQRIDELKQGLDTSQEISSEHLNNKNLWLTHHPQDLQHADFFIIAVPTPIDSAKHPDLSLLLAASETVAQFLKPRDIVVYESTVYPGVTEDECVPLLEKIPGLQCDQDFSVGYSPERINPGDHEHRFETITKVVSGSNPETLEIVAKVYETVVQAGVYRAPSIRVAEAAKVIENTQRDLNIALMNELAIIFNKMNIDTHEVLAAAKTKWNFLPFSPGLVGGHCIGVDPYYLTYKAQQYDYQPEVILAGRRINDSIGRYIAQQTIKKMIHAGCMVKDAKVGILGLTFKENCSDLRNSKVIDIISELEDYGIQCLVHDPMADSEAAHRHYNIQLQAWEDVTTVDALIIAVAHDTYLRYSLKDFSEKLSRYPLIIDVKGILDPAACSAQEIQLWRFS